MFNDVCFTIWSEQLNKFFAEYFEEPNIRWQDVDSSLTQLYFDDIEPKKAFELWKAEEVIF